MTRVRGARAHHYARMHVHVRVVMHTCKALTTSLNPKFGAHECVHPYSASTRTQRRGSLSTSAVGTWKARRHAYTSQRWKVSMGTTWSNGNQFIEVS